MAQLAYTVLDLRTDVRRILQEDGAQRVTDADILRWVNEGELFVAASTRALRTSTTAVSVSGTEAYSIPTTAPGAWAITRVDYDGTTLDPAPFEKRKESVDSVAPDTNGTPQLWSAYGQKYVLTPPPDTAGDVIKAWHAYLPEAMTADASALTIPVIFGGSVILYACHKGFMILGRQDRAMQMWQEFLQTMKMLNDKWMPDISLEARQSAG